jgi:hypothetical protein
MGAALTSIGNMMMMNHRPNGRSPDLYKNAAGDHGHQAAKCHARRKGVCHITHVLHMIGAQNRARLQSPQRVAQYTCSWRAALCLHSHKV